MAALHADIRADRAPQARYRLAAPRVLDNGAVEFEAVVSTPGVNRYPHIGRVEYVSADSISGPGYTAALRGLPLIDDPDLHTPGVTLEQVERARIGTILDARWDNEQQATIARIVVDVPRGIEQIRDRGVDGVSLHYTPDTEPADTAPDGTPITHVQTARSKLNHLLLTPSPNDSHARIRADEASMDPEKIKAMIDEAIGAKLAPLMERMDAMQAAMPKPKADEAVVEEVVVEPPRADTAADWQAVTALAAAHKVKIEPAAKLIDAQRAVVVKLMPQRADTAKANADTLGALVAGLAEGLKTSDVWQRLENDGTRRADAAPVPGLADLMTAGA